MLKIFVKWILRVVLASAIVVGGNIGLYYLYVFVF